MSSRRIIHQENNEFQILRQIEANPDVTQRQLSEKLNISLGSVNYALNALTARGWVKLKNFQNSDNKLGYAYLLTPEGATQKAMIAKRFWVRKLQEYEVLKQELQSLSEEFGEKPQLISAHESGVKLNTNSGHRQSDDSGNYQTQKFIKTLIFVREYL